MGCSELVPGAELDIPWQCSLSGTGDDAKRRVSIAEIGKAKAFGVGAVQAVAMNLDLPPLAELVDTFHADIGSMDTVTAQIREVAGCAACLLIARICKAIGVDIRHSKF